MQSEDSHKTLSFATVNVSQDAGFAVYFVLYKGLCFDNSLGKAPKFDKLQRSFLQTNLRSGISGHSMEFGVWNGASNWMFELHIVAFCR